MNKDRLKAIGKGFVYSVIFISLATIVFFIYTSLSHGKDYSYSFILNNASVVSVDSCSENWSYENLTAIPCVDLNLSLGGGIMAPFINWSLSPQDNCRAHGWVFPGFNIINETRNKELYLAIIPKCNTLFPENISIPWLEGNCNCTEKKKPERCDLFKCSDNFYIEQKW